jgi:hypothetical protein
MNSAERIAWGLLSLIGVRWRGIAEDEKSEAPKVPKDGERQQPFPPAAQVSFSEGAHRGRNPTQ